MEELWLFCPVSMVTLAPEVLYPVHVDRFLTLQTRAASETRSGPHQRLWMQGWAPGAGSVREWSELGLSRTA